MTPLYWFIIAAIVLSSQIMDWATTTYFISKGGWREVNPNVKETARDPKKFLITKCVVSAVLVGFLYFAYIKAPDIESFMLVSHGTVILSGVVAFLNPTVVCLYFLKDLYTDRIGASND